METDGKKLKRYYWLKLNKNFFRRLIMRKMLREPDGVQMQVVYLKILLESVENDGEIAFANVYDSIVEEIAEEIEESPETVQRTIDFLITHNYAEYLTDGGNLFFPEAIKLSGSEGESADRMRRKRARDKDASQSDEQVTQATHNVTLKETDKRDRVLERVIDRQSESEGTAEKADRSGNEISGNEIQSIPTLETVQEYARETHSPADPSKFHDWYEQNGWTDSDGKPIRNWKAVFDGWSRKERPPKKAHNFTQRSNSLTAMLDADGNL